MYIRARLPGGKDSRCAGLTTLPPSCADCLEILEPQPSGSSRASRGLYWESFTFYLLFELDTVLVTTERAVEFKSTLDL
jgi:hypothetical protein